MTSRRTTAATFALGLGAILVGLPASAGAASPETYAASATSNALDLQVFGNGITLGHTESGVASDPKANARGVGALLPGDTVVTENLAESTGEGQTNGTTEETCGPITLPDDFPAVDLATACSSAVTAIAGQLPTASSTGSVAQIGVATGELIGGTPLGDAVDQVNDTLGELLGDAPLPVDSLLDDLLSALNATADVVSIELGPASSSAATAADKVTSSGTAQGAVVELIHRLAPPVDDTPAVELPPMVTIEVGAATASANVTRATGEAAGEFDPALVRVTIAEDVAAALGMPEGANVIEIAPGQTQCLGLPDPLESCITVGNGAVTPTDTGITATAAGVSLDLLTGLPGGGVSLDLAAASATVSGTPAVAATTTTAPPELPRTGGTPWLPVAGVGLIGAAGLALGTSRMAGERRESPK